VDDRYVRLESAVEQLRDTVASLQQRIAALETSVPLTATPGAPAFGAATATTETQRAGTARAKRDQYDPIVILSLIGRLFLVLAGGFFLRAMTEAGVLSAPLGIALAFLYALVWLFMADRASRLGQSSSAIFHAVGAAMVAFPLLVEATTRFEVIGVPGAVLGLALLTAAFLFVAVRRQLHAVAWITVLAALPTCVVLFLKTGFAAPFALYLIALGVTTMWLAYAHGWTLIRWPVALLADLAVVGLAVRAYTLAQAGTVTVVMLLQVTLVAAYLGSIAVRTLLRDHNVTVFEVTQAAIALVVGFGGAIFLARSTGALPVVMGFASLVFGVACYALTFKFVGRHEGHERNVQFYAALALVLLLAGLTLDLHGQWLGIAIAVLAVLAVAAWARHGRLYLLLHGAVYVVAAGVASGALAYATWALVASPETWTIPDAATVAVVVAAALAAWFAARRAQPEGGLPASGLRLAIAAVLVWVVSGSVTGYLAAATVGSVEGKLDLGALATVRTGVLALATLFVAWGARQGRLREWAWLVYPLLVFIGLKMVAQDFKHSRPATLFIALALYGIALIVAPRLRRAVGKGSAPAASPGGIAPIT
jgi:hypothetical protein